MRYCIIVEKTAADLSRKVNAAISEGWKPQGGVSIGSVAMGTAPMFAQALVHEVPSQTARGTEEET